MVQIFRTIRTQHAKHKTMAPFVDSWIHYRHLIIVYASMHLFLNQQDKRNWTVYAKAKYIWVLYIAALARYAFISRISSFMYRMKACPDRIQLSSLSSKFPPSSSHLIPPPTPISTRCVSCSSLSVHQPPLRLGGLRPSYTISLSIIRSSS